MPDHGEGGKVRERVLWGLKPLFKLMRFIKLTIDRIIKNKQSSGHNIKSNNCFPKDNILEKWFPFVR